MSRLTEITGQALRFSHADSKGRGSAEQEALEILVSCPYLAKRGMRSGLFTSFERRALPGANIFGGDAQELFFIRKIYRLESTVEIYCCSLFNYFPVR